jgi:hypothetical protein
MAAAAKNASALCTVASMKLTWSERRYRMGERRRAQYGERTTMGGYTVFALVLALALGLPAGPALAQPKAPVDLTKMPPVPNDYSPKKTAWGDPDFTGMWPINDIAEIPVSRPDKYGNRFYKTD